MDRARAAGLDPHAVIQHNMPERKRPHRRHVYKNQFSGRTGVNSIDINFGPKMGPKIGPRCQIKNWTIGRPWQAFTHWQN